MSHVALILPNLGIGGAEKVALSLARGFLERGHSVDLVLLSATGKLLDQVPKGVRIVDLAAPRIRKAILPLAKYFRSAKPQSVQAFMWPVTVAAVIARFVSRMRFKLTLSDHTTVSEHYSHFGRIRMVALAKSIGLFYPLADSRITVSLGAASDLEALSGVDDFIVIRNPVSAPAPVETDMSGLWRGRRRLLAVGNLSPAKDYPTLLSAVALLPDDIGLVVVGGGALLEELQRQSERLGIAGRVLFIGAQSATGPFYEAAELFVMSSKHEGWPLVMIEALLSGLPVVSTDCPSGPSEILEGGEYGLLVPVSDPQALSVAIKRALGNENNATRQRERGVQVSGQASIDEYAFAMGLS